MFLAVLQDFCKLAVDYLQKGPNIKVYNAAARKKSIIITIDKANAWFRISDYITASITFFRKIER